MNGTKRRRGFTLVEVLFGALITGLLLGICYNIFYAQHHTAYKLDKKNEALKSALVACQAIQRDLRQLVSLPLDQAEDGKVTRRYGDVTAPVKIGYRERSISFYVPKAKADMDGAVTDEREEPAQALTYALVPSSAPGTYGIKRILGEVNSEEEAQAADGRLIKGVTVRDLRFRLLDPKSSDPERRSPDLNYYVETHILGTDATLEETQALSPVTILDHPSAMLRSPSLQANVRYVPDVALATPADVFNITPKEEQTLGALDKANKDFREGRMSPEEFEKKIEELVNRHAGDPGHGPILDSTGRVVPRLTNLRVRTPSPEAGQPIHLSDGNNTHVIVPPPPPAPGAERPRAKPISIQTVEPGDLFVAVSYRTFTQGPDGKWIPKTAGDMQAGGSKLTDSQKDGVIQSAKDFISQNNLPVDLPWDKMKTQGAN